MDTADVRPRGITGGVIGRKVNAVRINDDRHAVICCSQDAVRQGRCGGEEHAVQGRAEGGVRPARAEDEVRPTLRARQGAEGDGRAGRAGVDLESTVAPGKREATCGGFRRVSRGVGRILERATRKDKAIGTAETVGQEGR